MTDRDPRREHTNADTECFENPTAAHVLALLEQAADLATDDAPIVRVEIPVAPASPRAWLQAQRNAVKTYWADREHGFEMAGIGAADLIEGTEPVDYARRTAVARLFDRMRKGLPRAYPNLRYYGGLRFDPEAHTDPRWTPWGVYRFVLPRFELFNMDGRSYFVCNAIFPAGGRDSRRAEDLLRASARRGPTSVGARPLAPWLRGIRDELAYVAFPERPISLDMPTFISRKDCPDRTQWRVMVESAIGDFARHRIEKVVLARVACLDFSGPVDPMALLERLNASANNAFLFSFQPDEGTAFFGATPERLYKRVGHFVQSEALAGTTIRGASDETDVALGEALLHNDKELREHGFVRDSIRAAFQALCREVREDKDLSLVRLRDCQHLVCRFEGLLDDANSDADVLRALHPTPAVGGYPTPPAMAWIAKAEPFDRGWYAGPVGWVGYDSSEFAVAIRSARVDANTLSLYAGAGIVPGSDPDQEWAEIENKMGLFLNVLIPHAD